jgi:predicted CXXCH cytochrome family protein
MNGRSSLALVAALVALATGGAYAGALRPLRNGERAATSHMPYVAGLCDQCHTRNDPRNPGPVEKKSPQLCLECHDDFTGVRKGHPDRGDCTGCHNPHDSTKRKLLL